MDPHRLGAKPLREAAALLAERAPLVLGVHEQLGADRQPREIEVERTLGERTACLAHDGDQIEVASDTLIAAGVRPEVSQAQELRMRGSEPPGKRARGGVNRFPIRPPEDARIWAARA